MSDISKKISEALSEGKYMDKSKKFKFFEQPDIFPMIKELGDYSWSEGKKMRVEAMKKMMKIALSNENIAKAFMKGMDRASSKLAETLAKRYSESFFSVKKKRGLKEDEVVDLINAEVDELFEAKKVMHISFKNTSELKDAAKKLIKDKELKNLITVKLDMNQIVFKNEFARKKAMKMLGMK